MNLASSSYYYQPKADLDRQARSDAELRDHIERIQGEFSGYGYRRLGKQLRREGIYVNDKRIRRVQRKYQLFPIRWQSFKIATTDSNHGHKVYPNLLAGLTPTGINQAWVADITYIRILKGFVFLAALLDRYSRKVIGWAISKRIDAEFARPQAVGRTGLRVSRAGYGRLRRPNQRMEPMALRATAHPQPRYVWRLLKAPWTHGSRPLGAFITPIAACSMLVVSTWPCSKGLT